MSQKDFSLGKWIKKSRKKVPLNEGVSDTFNTKCTVDVNFERGAVYEGKPLAYFFYNDAISMNLQYAIEIDMRSWGLKDISVYHPTGDKEITFDIELEDGTEAPFTGAINWDMVEMEKEYGSQGYMVNPTEISLDFDKNCKFIKGTVTY